MENLKNFLRKVSCLSDSSTFRAFGSSYDCFFVPYSSFFLNIPGKGVLKLDNGTIVYDGSLVRGKMNGQGTITFQNGDQYTGGFNNGAFNGKGTFQSKEGWTYEGDFVNGQAEGKGKLTTEQEVVYEGTFKQGVFQQK